MAKVKSALLTYCKEQNVESVRTGEGLFYRGVTSRYWTNDWESMGKFIATRAFRLPNGGSGSVAKADVAATGSTTFDIRKNGSSVATFNFGAGNATAAFTVTGDQDFAAGDVLTITAPATPDATLSGIGASLACLRRS
jgi:hypothetical protein